MYIFLLCLFLWPWGKNVMNLGRKKIVLFIPFCDSSVVKQEVDNEIIMIKL